MAEQQEKAYQKQDNVFLNSKAVLMKVKSEKQLRYYKAVGLGTDYCNSAGFKIPKEASNGTYIDKKCPFTGNVSIRGRILKGICISTKMKNTVVIRRDFLHYVPKYRRFEKRQVSSRLYP